MHMKYNAIFFKNDDHDHDLFVVPFINSSTIFKVKTKRLLNTGFYMSSTHGVKQENYLLSSIWFLFFFICWGACFPWLSLWLTEKIGIHSTEVGMVYTCIAIVAVIFQPIFGILADKLSFRKHLMWMLAGLMIAFAPWWIWVFAPLLKINILAGALAGGIFIGLAFGCGCGICEAWIDKVSRLEGFEFGRARMWGGIGAAVGTFISGKLFNINPDYIFIMASCAGIVLAILLCFFHPGQHAQANLLSSHRVKINRSDVISLLKTRRFWFLVLYMVGVGAVYETYDQQFAVYYSSFFATRERGAEVFGYLYTVQIFLDALTMFFAPVIVNRIGPKNALLYCGFIMAFRIVGSAMATGPILISTMKLLHGFESSILIIATLKYISGNFDWRLSATVYLIGFQFAKQFSQIFMSTAIGNMYDVIGFRESYTILGTIALCFTILSIFTLSGNRALQPEPAL